MFSEGRYGLGFRVILNVDESPHINHQGSQHSTRLYYTGLGRKDTEDEPLWRLYPDEKERDSRTDQGLTKHVDHTRTSLFLTLVRVLCNLYNNGRRTGSHTEQLYCLFKRFFFRHTYIYTYIYQGCMVNVDSYSIQVCIHMCTYGYIYMFVVQDRQREQLRKMRGRRRWGQNRKGEGSREDRGWHRKMESRKPRTPPTRGSYTIYIHFQWQNFRPTQTEHKTHTIPWPS